MKFRNTSPGATGFIPRSVELTFETQEELDDFTTLVSAAFRAANAVAGGDDSDYAARIDTTVLGMHLYEMLVAMGGSAGV